LRHAEIGPFPDDPGADIFRIDANVVIGPVIGV